MVKGIGVFIRVFILLVALSAKGQVPLLRHLSTKDGLGSNTIYRIKQDSQGFLWFCTDQGLSQFDGHEFQNYTSRQGLPDNEVFNVKEDNAHRLWLACYNNMPCFIADRKVHNVSNNDLCKAVERFDPHDAFTIGAEQRQPFFIDHHPKNVTLSMAVLLCSYFNPEEVNNLFTQNGIEYCLNHGRLIATRNNTIKQIFPQKIMAAYAYKNQFYAYVKVKEKKILYKLALTGDTALVKEEMPVPYRIYAFDTFEDNTLLLATESGVMRYTEGHVDTNCMILDHIPVSSIHKDNEGNYWFSTLTDGAYMLPHSMPLLYNKKAGADNNVGSVCVTRWGALITGYDNGCVKLFDSTGTTTLLPGSGYRNRIVKLLLTRDNKVLAGSDAGLYILDLTKQKVDGYIHNAVKNLSLNGKECLIGSGSGATNIDLNSEKQHIYWNKRTTAIVADANNTIWLGTLEGVYTIRGGIYKKPAMDTLLNGSRITDLAVCGSTVIIGTNQYGIYLWHNNKMHHLNELNGLSSNVCKKIVVDENGDVWVCTSKGINKITITTGSDVAAISHFTTSDGVPENGINDFTIWGDQIYIATTEGVVVLHMNRNRARLPVPTYITSIHANDITYTGESDLTFDHDQNNLQVYFTGISYSGSDNLQYKYILEGTKIDTVYTTINTVNLSAINPGQYKLLIWAKYEDGPWSEKPASQAFTILPPFWQTAWFIVLSTVIIAMGIYLLFKRRVRMIRNAAKEKTALYKRMTELEMQALRAQINPHFVFNALNSIQNYYNQNDELNANRYMTTFAKLIRQTFTHASDQWLTLANEVEMIQTYIDLERMRFKNNFTTQITIGEGIIPDQLKIPAMLIQPYVENAINHGLRHLTGDGMLCVSFAIENEALVCTIEDNGVGLKRSAILEHKAKEHRSMGMEITRKRIETINEIYNTQIQVHVKEKCADIDVQGTIVEMIIPLAKETAYEYDTNDSNRR